MKKLLIIFCFLPLFSFSQNWDWIRREGNHIDDDGLSICSDDNGNIYVAADTSYQGTIIKYDNAGNRIWQVNTINRQSNPIYSPTPNSLISDHAGYLYHVKDSFCSKYDTSGILIWRLNVGGWSNGLSMDNSGYIYLTGRGNAFLQKRDSAGSLIWNQVLGATGNGIYTDAFGNSYYNRNIWINHCLRSRYSNSKRMALWRFRHIYCKIRFIW